MIMKPSSDTYFGVKDAVLFGKNYKKILKAISKFSKKMQETVLQYKMNMTEYSSLP